MRPIDGDKLYQTLNVEIHVTGKENAEAVAKGLTEIASQIMGAPTLADPRRRGHWIHDLIGAYYHSACRCSVCGCHVEVESNYCPLCGADMQTARPIDIDCMGL